MSLKLLLWRACEGSVTLLLHRTFCTAGQETRYQFASLKQFLQKFRPPPLALSSCDSTQTTTKDIQPPSKVRDWQAFEPGK